MTTTAKTRLLGLLGAGVLALGGCGEHVEPHDMPDGSTPPSALTLSIAMKAPQLEGLVFTGGKLELRRVSLFGDVAADERTMATGINVKLPTDEEDLRFEEAPFGLYSRVRADVDELQAEGSWRGTPLAIRLEVESPVDLRGPTLDYNPSQAARFALTIDAGAWLDAAALDGAAVDDGQIRIDYLHNLGLALGLPDAIQGSFALDSGGAPP